MKALKGKTINEVYISDDKVWLKFELANGKYVLYKARNECCNDVWFNHISGLKSLLGAKVLSVHKKPMIEKATPTKQGEDDIYGWTIITANGYFDVEMRNSSNGYYGGHLERIEYPWRQSYPNPLDKVTFKKLFRDF